jgi:translation elongation factor EF-Ts
MNDKGFAPSRAHKDNQKFIIIRSLMSQTGATKEECYKALAESRGDFLLAVEWLRKNMKIK